MNQRISTKVQSFDVFDTLVGRFHYTQDSTFKIVEKKFPYKNFTSYRITADQVSNGTLEDAYAILRNTLDEKKEVISNLLDFELSSEMNNLFPILLNVNKVRDGDILVSDTFYDKETLESFLRKLGINMSFKLFATPNGKGSGYIWNEIKKNYEIVSHLGDNLHADVEHPRKFGIKTEFFNPHLSDIETKIRINGHHDLGNLLRATRLSNPFSPESKEFKRYLDFCEKALAVFILNEQVFFEEAKKREETTEEKMALETLIKFSSKFENLTKDEALAYAILNKKI